MDYDSIKLMNSNIKIYKNFPLPVVLCDKNLKPFWSNDCAKSFLNNDDNLFNIEMTLLEYDCNKLFEKLESKGNITIPDFFPFSNVMLSVSPLFNGEQTVGAALMFYKQGTLPDRQELYSSAKTAFAISSSVRDTISDMFMTMDSAVLKAQIFDNESMLSSFDRIAIDNYKILRVTNNITEYARFQCKNQNVVFEAVNILSWLRIIKDTVVHIGENIGIPVTFDIPEKDCYAKLDLDLFERAFFNILHNSFYYTRQDNSVVISATCNEENVFITVTDKGLGIPPQQMEKILLPYYSYSHDHKDAGLGLGLTLANIITKIHEGKLEINSVLGSGTSVTVTLSTNVFSHSIPFSQGADSLLISDRFSHLYTGLYDACLSPYIQEKPAKTSDHYTF